ncbi:MAG: GPW/gp25 family protein [bacterium]
MEYFSLPLVLREGYLLRTNLEESIIYSVGLIISTRIGQMPFAPEYGCNIWEKEYSDLMAANSADIRSGLRNAIDKFEKRLYSVSVSLVNTKKDDLQVNNVVIKVTGNYKDGSEEKRLEHHYSIN